MKVNLITSELIVQARAALQRFIEGKGRLCIPAHPTDDDMLLSEALDRLQVLSDPGHVLVALASSDAPRWTPVAEGLPEKIGSYLVHVEHTSLVWGQEYSMDFFDVAIWYEGEFTSAELRFCRNSSAEGTVVTHWMPLPPAPEGMEWK